ISRFSVCNVCVDLTLSGVSSPYGDSLIYGEVIEDLASLSAGCYTVTVTDANGCTVTETITITQPDVLALSYTSVNVSCFGGNNGSIDLTLTGGTAPYTYSWSNGASVDELEERSVGGNTQIRIDVSGCALTAPVTNAQ